MPRFFTALNPLSSDPSIKSQLIVDEEDLTLAETLEIAWENTWTDEEEDYYGFFYAVFITFEVLIGNHYHFQTASNSRKGVLDFFILPLLARKIICNNFPETAEEQADKHILQKTAEWGMAICIALPIEIVRFAVALALTIALIPVVALVHIAKNIRDYMQREPAEEAQEYQESVYRP